MFGITDYGAFVVTVLIFLLIPGPGNLALALSTAKGGLGGGLAATFGVILGDQVLMWSALAGLAALLHAYPSAFSALQWLGAAYLAWLGARMLLARSGRAPVIDIRPRHYLRQALVITLLNPKAVLFYMAFFPLFVDPVHQQGMWTYGAMALTIAVLTLLYGLAAISLTHFLADRFRHTPSLGRGLEKLAGLALLGFGVKLVLGR